MPVYVNNPSGNNPVQMLLRGVPGYAIGSRNANQPTTLFQITQVALTSNVATITGLIREGFIPIIGSLITIRGTATGGGTFNVTNVAIASVTIDKITGIGTITFALVSANVGAVADAGQAYVPAPETAEALVNESSQAFAIQEAGAGDDNQLVVTWSTEFPSAPGAVTVNLQGAINNSDAEYTTIDTSTAVGGETRWYTGTRFRFVRLNIAGASGGSSPTMVGKILV